MAKPRKKSQAEIEGEALSLRGKIYSYWAELLLLNILAVFPLFMAQKYFNLTRYKAYYLWISALVMFVILVIAALTFTGLIKSKGFMSSVKTVSLPDAAVSAYWLFVVLSAVFSPMPDYTNGEINFTFFLTGVPERHDAIISITVYVLLYFAVSRLYKNRNRDWMVFAVSACIVSLIGIFQFMGWDIFDIYPYGFDDPNVAGIYPFNYLDAVFRTTLGNVDIVSPFVAIAVCFFLALYMKSDKKIRFLYLITTALTFCLMITSGADGGKVGVLAGIVLLFILNITDKKAIAKMFFAISLGCLFCIIYNPVLAARDYFYATGIEQHLYWGAGWYKSIWVLGAFACLALGLAVYFTPVWIKAKARFAALVTTAIVIVVAFAGIEIMGPRFSDNYENIIWQARETLHGNFDDLFGSGRAVLWKDTAKVVFDHPLLGTGPDTFEYALYDYQAHLAEVTNTTFDKAHNDYLQILVCNGFLGLGAFLLFIISLAVKAVPKVWNNPLLMAVVGACGAYAVQAFFGISTPMVTPLFFVMLGLAENFRIGRHELQYNVQDI